MPMKNSRSKPFVLGISGGSGSGKSTIINEIVERLGPEKIAVLHYTMMHIIGTGLNYHLKSVPKLILITRIHWKQNF